MVRIHDWELCYPYLMSKTQEKKAARLAEAQEFVKERRERQIAVFESNLSLGTKWYEDNKDIFTPEQLATLDADLAAGKAALEEYKAKWL